VLNKLISLKTLDLSNNEIRTIPSDLRLKKLQTLDLSNNQLTDVDFVKHLPSLDALYLEENDEIEVCITLAPLKTCIV